MPRYSLHPPQQQQHGHRYRRQPACEGRAGAWQEALTGQPAQVGAGPTAAGALGGHGGGVVEGWWARDQQLQVRLAGTGGEWERAGGRGTNSCRCSWGAQGGSGGGLVGAGPTAAGALEGHGNGGGLGVGGSSCRGV